jgi:hypothetical protein
MKEAYLFFMVLGALAGTQYSLANSVYIRYRNVFLMALIGAVNFAILFSLGVLVYWFFNKGI